jgi:hypothetical protein
LPYSSTNSFCPNSTNYDCDIANWTCTGGGPDTYAGIFDSSLSTIIEGSKVVYFGNYYCNACSNVINDTTCINNTGCEATGIPANHPVNLLSYGGITGVSLSQTVNSLTPGVIYLLEFWVGGEFYYTDEGLFAVDVGFGNIFLRNPPTPASASTGRRYIIVFTAISSSHTIKFTNWGHICSACTELILDDVRLFTSRDASNPCATAINELTQNTELRFYPNPASSNSEITFTYPSFGSPSEIVINNIDGKEVVRYALPLWSTVQHLKLPKLAAGVYVARLVGGRESANVKFVVQ